MTTELYWTGQDDVEVFHDTKRNIEYWPSERPREVPDEAVEWYLSFPGWSEDLPAEDDDDEFDSLAFIDDNWQTVTADIRRGEADGYLDVVEETEENRSAGPRQSVIEAIIDRRERLNEE